MVCSYECPYCNTPEHLSIIFGENISSFLCVKCSTRGSLFTLLSKIKRLDLILSHKSYDKEVKLERKLNLAKLNIDYSNYKVSSISPPIGFKRIYSDSYLEGRGFTNEQFNLFKVGITKIDPKLRKDYIVFLIEEEGETIAYLSRSKKSKEEINFINKNLKAQGIKNKYLRWINSSSDFEKILFGYNELTPNTKTVILVEGPTSKFNVDRKLALYQQEEFKCCSTFGKKVTGYQIKRLSDKGIENVILLHDPDAINETKHYSLELNKYFNTLVGWIPFMEMDPGDLDENQLNEVLQKLETPLDFNKNKLLKKELL